MSNDVAKIIYTMSKRDANMDGLELKELFRKKVDCDSENLKKTLRTFIEQKIKSEIQPFYSELSLSGTQMQSNYIFGGQASVKLASSCPEKYKFRKPNSDIYEVVNSETKMLIDKAIIPLDLKWRLGYGNEVIVSWTHWIDSK